MPNENSAAELQTVLLILIRAMVDTPDAVTVDADTNGDETVLRVRVAQGDAGKLIGKQGRTARSLRIILQACGMKYKQRFALDIEGALRDSGDPA